MNTFVINNEALRKAWGAEGQFWFSHLDNTIVEDINLIHLDVPDDIEKEEFFKLKDIIPYLNIKRFELAKAYIQTIDNEKIKAKFEALEDNEIVEYFWKYFHVYPKYFEKFEDFQNNYIICRLKKWCEDNNINYEVII